MLLCAHALLQAGRMRVCAWGGGAGAAASGMLRARLTSAGASSARDLESGPAPQLTCQQIGCIYVALSVHAGCHRLGCRWRLRDLKSSSIAGQRGIRGLKCTIDAQGCHRAPTPRLARHRKRARPVAAPRTASPLGLVRQQPAPAPPQQRQQCTRHGAARRSPPRSAPPAPARPRGARRPPRRSQP